MGGDRLVSAARGLWSELSGVPGGWSGTRVTVAPSSRLCPAGWVGVVTVDDAAVVTVPEERLLTPVRQVVRGRPVGALGEVSTWASLGVVTVLGPARLLYGPQDGTPTPEDVDPVEPGDADVAALLAGVAADEAEESGLEGVTSPVFVRRGADGTVAAAAGYVRWPARTAHVCVLTAAAARGHGHARAVGAAAVGHAAAAGLLVQWRARAGPSVSVARRLGLRDLGAQLSLLPG